jgi:hypothetical protein
MAACPRCILVNPTKDGKSELMFSWPIDSPFTTIHADLCSAGEIEIDESQLHMMTSMCAMTQYVVPSYAERMLACNLALLFMQDVLLKVGFFVVVAMDDGGTFK